MVGRIAVIGLALAVSGCGVTPYGSVGIGTRIGNVHVGTGIGVPLGHLGGFGGGFGSGFGGGPKASAGSFGGAVLGGLAGSRFGQGTGKLVAVGLGTLLGSVLGGSAGRSLDRADELYARQAAALAYAAPVGQSYRWSNPHTGNTGTVTTTRDGWSSSGAYCREFQQTVIVGGAPQAAYGAACQQPDGSWRILAQ